MPLPDISGGLPGSRAGYEPLRPILEASPERPFVIAQLGQSLDGRIATITGESRWINRDAALDHLHRVRASVDAVVVGIGTVLADDPLLNVRRCPLGASGRQPARVVIDPSGRLPSAARCLAADDGARRIVIGTGAPPLADCEAIALERAADGRLCPRAVVSALFAAGLKRLLIEGGATTVSAFIDADAVDRLHLLVAPVIIGAGKTGLALQPEPSLAKARRPVTRVHVLADGDVLFDCELRPPHARVEAAPPAAIDAAVSGS